MKDPIEPVTVLCRECKITLITMSRRSDWKNDPDFDLCCKCDSRETFGSDIYGE